ncbi:TPA: hypothetical protein N0F65_006547 [Lagenidium giganteum]|uniref:Secreted protein n=1 Tax=Lagenidium giganteum TaxID=4803 RepID=A0AAV2YRM0_9STRA|nr:TPA: hypothetical protein N0F65_006547 [Lagenidium giganteum]
MCVYTARAASSVALFSSGVPLVSICSARADSSPPQHACANCRQHREVLVALVHVRHQLRQAATQFLLRAVVRHAALDWDVLDYGEAAAQDLHQRRLARARLAQHQRDGARSEHAVEVVQDLIAHHTGQRLLQMVGDCRQLALGVAVLVRHGHVGRDAEVLEPHFHLRQRLAQRHLDANRQVFM